LVWKISSQKIDTSKPFTPLANLSNAALFSNLDKCKIIDGDPQTTNMTAGFPIPDGRIDLVKGAKMQIIGVDFPDKIGGTKSPKELNQNLTSSVEKFWTAQSSIPVKFDWKWSSDWIRMPNSINYSTYAQTLALKKGNFWIGPGDVGKGPTSTTDYWNGITPPAGGYTIYLNKASGGPSIYTAANDSTLISLSNTIAGQTFATVAAALDWFATQTDKMVFDMDYPAIVTNGLVLNLDAGLSNSQYGPGTVLVIFILEPLTLSLSGFSMINEALNPLHAI
jgi:hypothetical protein